MPLFMLDGAGICRVGIAHLFAYLAGMNRWAVPTLRGYLHDIGHASRCDGCVGAWLITPYKFRLGCNWARHLTSMIAFARMIFGVFGHFNHQVFACDNRLA